MAPLCIIIQSITYTFYDDFGQEKTGSVDFYYSHEGDTYIIDIIPNMEEEFYYLPERFLLVPEIGTGAVPYGARELRFEYKVNPDGTIRQLHVINKEPQLSDTVGWMIQYHSNGIPSMIGMEYPPSDIQQVYYDESGFPLYSTVNDLVRLSKLDVDGQSFTESEFVKIIGYADSTGRSDCYKYEVYETNAQHSEMTQYSFFPNGELMTQETTEWEYYPVTVLKAPFPFIYHRELDY